MPPVVFLLTDRNSAPATTVLAAAKLHQAGAPIVVVLPQTITSPDDTIAVAQGALEQILVEGSLFPLRWWGQRNNGEQPAIWVRRRDGRLFVRDLRGWAAEINGGIERNFSQSEQLEGQLRRVLEAYTHSEQPAEADQLLRQARDIQAALNENEQAEQQPMLALALRPPELLQFFNLVRPQTWAAALANRAERRQRTGPRVRPREVTITAPELVPVNDRQIVTITVGGLSGDAMPERRGWLERLLERIDPRAIDLRAVSFDIAIKVYGARIEGSPIRRINIAPDLPAPPVALSIVAEQPGTINLFVEVTHAADSRQPHEVQDGVVAGNHIQMRSVQGTFPGPEAASTIQQQSPFTMSGAPEEPLAVIAPQLPALLMTLRLEPQERAGDYRVSMQVYVPDDHMTYELLEAEPIHLNTARLLQYSNDPLAYGRELKSALLASEELQRSWAHAIGFYRGMGRVVRLRLHLVGNADQLHTTHWETLIDPSGDRPLALNRRILLSRYLSCRDAQRFSSQRRPDQPVRIAVVVASPHNIRKYELQPIDVEAEVDAVCHYLAAHSTTLVGNYPPHRMASLRSLHRHLANATIDSIQRAANGMQILYLVCHGKRVREVGDGVNGGASERSYLMLEASDGTTDKVEAGDFAAALTSLPQPPSLVVLASCYSAGDGYQEALRSIGPLLCKAGVPAVLAFQGLVAIDTVRRLVPALLHGLLDKDFGDGTIDAAVAAARVELLGAQWWQPILWMRRDDGRAW